MDAATYNNYVTTIGKDRLLGVILDNSRRILRREKVDPVTGNPLYDVNGRHVLETYDERVGVDVALEALFYYDKDINGIDTVSYVPMYSIHGFVAAVNAEDVNKVDFRYIVG